MFFIQLYFAAIADVLKLGADACEYIADKARPGARHE